MHRARPPGLLLPPRAALRLPPPAPLLALHRAEEERARTSVVEAAEAEAAVLITSPIEGTAVQFLGPTRFARSMPPVEAWDARTFAF
jgi:hypothetical protein